MTDFSFGDGGEICHSGFQNQILNNPGKEKFHNGFFICFWVYFGGQTLRKKGLKNFIFAINMNSGNKMEGNKI